MENKALELVPKILALFTSLLIFLGIVGSVVYYKSFSIDILDNITLGEALILFISNFSPLAIGTLFGVVISRMYFEQHNEATDTDNDNVRPTIKLSLSVNQKLFATLVITPLFILSFLGFSPLDLWTIPVALIVRLFVLWYITKRLRLILQAKKLDTKLADYVQIAGVSIILMAAIAMTRAYLVYQGDDQVVTLHNKDGEIMKSDSTTLYLGKSNSFYYLYNKKNKKAIIIKEDQINRIEIE